MMINNTTVRVLSPQKALLLSLSNGDIFVFLGLGLNEADSGDDEQ